MSDDLAPPFRIEKSHDLDAPWALELRAQAEAALEKLAVPEAHEEIWRYTDIARLPRVDSLAVVSPDQPVSPMDSPAELPETFAGLLTYLESFGPRSALIINTDQGVVLAQSDAAGLKVAELERSPEATAAGSLVPTDQDLFTALNACHFNGGVHVTLDRAVRLADPVMVVHVMGDPGTAFYPRTLISISDLAELEVVEIFLAADNQAHEASRSDGEAATSLCASVVELAVGDGARLDHVGIQMLPSTTCFIGSQRATVGRDARLETGSAALGADVGRLRIEADLIGAGGEFNAYGLYVGDQARHIDFRTQQHHVAPNCKSKLLFRGCVGDRSSAIFSGLIRIEPEAANSDAHQASHYLILSPEARAASIPNLEILNHDVICGHATSGGPPGEDQIHYLATRGIDPSVAERMIIDGFFADVIGHLPVACARQPVLKEAMALLGAIREEAK